MQGTASQVAYPRPRYCMRHGKSEMRPKTKEVRSQDCVGCGQSIDTNLAEFQLCAMCCHYEQRCMVCGGAAPDAPGAAMPAAPPAAPAQRTPAPASASAARGAPSGGGGGALGHSVEYLPQGNHVAPRFCGRHNTSERRVKAEERQVKCSACRMDLVTNYKEFSLCNGCSSGQERCMICGSNAPQAGFYIPSAARLS